MEFRDFYSTIKPFIPRFVQIYMRSCWVYHLRKQNHHIWPIDEAAHHLPANWNGWPEGKKFAFVLTHDVDTEKGQKHCLELAGLEENLDFCSSFNLVPERYEISSEFLSILRTRGFEIGLHGRDHKGNPFRTAKIFQREKQLFNHYLRKLDCVGFRTPCMYHNLNMIGELDIEYDASTFDTDPFEPQPDGVGTIFPFLVKGLSDQKGFIELPYTLPQDFTLFILMRERNIDVWKKKMDWIAERGGMVLLNTHPDYMNFNGKQFSLEGYPVSLYESFLSYVKTNFKNQYWHALPRDVSRFMTMRNLELVEGSEKKDVTYSF